MTEDEFADFVPHPRFGRSPIRSEEQVPLSVFRDHWPHTTRTGRIFPESAIWADVGRQKPSPVSRPAYVDLRVDCRDCGRPFLFFAVEQKQWYEELKLPFDAPCVRCPECRKRDQRTRRLRSRLADLTTREDELDDAGRIELAELLTEFLCRGEVKRPDKVRRALNRIGDREAFAERIAEVRRRIESREGTSAGE